MNNRTVEQLNNRTVEQLNSGTIEQLNRGTIEQLNNRTVEQLNNRSKSGVILMRINSVIRHSVIQLFKIQWFNYSSFKCSNN